MGGSAQSDGCSGRVAESWRYCRRCWGGAIISAAIDIADSTPPIGYLLLKPPAWAVSQAGKILPHGAGRCSPEVSRVETKNPALGRALLLRGRTHCLRSGKALFHRGFQCQHLFAQFFKLGLAEQFFGLGEHACFFFFDVMFEQLFNHFHPPCKFG